MDDFKTVEEIERAREILECRIDAFLRKQGWKSTTDTPGSYVMWERTIRGRNVLVDKNFALSLQGEIDLEDDAPDHADDVPDSS